MKHYSIAIRTQILFWLGLTGSVFTVFTHLRDILQFSHWANFLADQWHYYVQENLRKAILYLGIEIPPIILPAIIFTIFYSLFTLGSAAQTSQMTKSSRSTAQLATKAVLPGLYAIVAAASAWMLPGIYYYIVALAVPTVAAIFISHDSLKLSRKTRIGIAVAPFALAISALALAQFIKMNDQHVIGVLITCACLLTIALAIAVAGTLASASNFEITIYYTLFSVFAFIVLMIPLDVQWYTKNGGSEHTHADLFFIGPFFIVWLLAALPPYLSSYRAANIRMLFILTGISILMGVSQLSKLGLDIDPPPTLPIVDRPRAFQSAPKFMRPVDPLVLEGLSRDEKPAFPALPFPLHRPSPTDR